MRRYLLLMFTLLAVVMASGCVTDQGDNATKTFSQNNVTFQYPSDWVVVQTTSPDAVAAVADPSSVISGTNSPTTQVVIQKPNVTAGTNLTEAYNDNYATFFNETGYQKVSEANITTDKLTALENIYTSSASGIEKQYRAVWLEKNSTIYVILCSSKKADFESLQSKFDIIVNSFQAL
ncbi:MAG: PsbP-related protein [Methanobacteriaceae archaeon]